MNCTPALWIPIGIFLMTFVCCIALVRVIREINELKPSLEAISESLEVLMALLMILLVGTFVGGVLIVFPLPR